MTLKLIFRPLIALFFGISLMIGATAQAQEKAPDDLAWQVAITGQIEAFRQKDAPAAFGFAGEMFRNTFPDPQSFFVTIIGSGYAPIMDSSSHSFGRYERVGDAVVMQVVNFVGSDQQLYSALYQVQEERDGWRVQGVSLVKKPGVAI